MIKYPYKGKGIQGLKEKIENYTAKDLLQIFRAMFRIRLIEEEIATRYQDNEMKSPVHLANGQEAVAVGSCMALRKEDLVYCGHRTHAVYLAKGGNLDAMLSELHCRSNGCCASRGGSMHLLDKEVGMAGSSAIVAGIIPIATGAALAAKLQGKDHKICVFFGDAAVEEGAFWESINFAKLKELPILYICENNYYSVCSPLEHRQALGINIADKVRAFGLESWSLDGNNVLEVHEATQRAVHLLQKGNGPVFFEAHTYRWMGHHGDREDLGYRSQEELASWKQVDPLLLLKEVLSEQGMLSRKQQEEFAQEIQREIVQGFERALQSPFPLEEDLLTHVYA